MGQAFSYCWPSSDAVLDAPTNDMLQIPAFLQEIRGRLLSDLERFPPDRAITLRKIIHPEDLEAPSPPPTGSYTYIKSSSDFLIDASFGVAYTNSLIQNIIDNLYTYNISMFPHDWLMLVANIRSGKDLECGKTKLLQLCFLSHLSKMADKTSALQLSRSIEYVEMVIEEDLINLFCAAAIANPKVQKMVGPGFIQPRIIPFRFRHGASTSWDFRGFVLDGNFIAVREDLLRDFDEINHAARAMYTKNVCFHETIHAANRQYQNNFNIHTPEKPGLISTEMVATNLMPLEAGLAGELALWGMVPDWPFFDPAEEFDVAENLARELTAQYKRDGTLVLNEDQKRRLTYAVGVDKSMVSSAGMVIKKLIRFM